MLCRPCNSTRSAARSTPTRRSSSASRETRRAAVAMVLAKQPEGPSVLFIERAQPSGRPVVGAHGLPGRTRRPGRRPSARRRRARDARRGRALAARRRAASAASTTSRATRARSTSLLISAFVYALPEPAPLVAEPRGARGVLVPAARARRAARARCRTARTRSTSPASSSASPTATSSGGSPTASSRASSARSGARCRIAGAPEQSALRARHGSGRRDAAALGHSAPRWCAGRRAPAAADSAADAGRCRRRGSARTRCRAGCAARSRARRRAHSPTAGSGAACARRSRRRRELDRGAAAAVAQAHVDAAVGRGEAGRRRRRARAARRPRRRPAAEGRRARARAAGAPGSRRRPRARRSRSAAVRPRCSRAAAASRATDAVAVRGGLAVVLDEALLRVAAREHLEDAGLGGRSRRRARPALRVGITEPARTKSGMRSSGAGTRSAARTAIERAVVPGDPAAGRQVELALARAALERPARPAATGRASAGPRSPPSPGRPGTRRRAGARPARRAPPPRGRARRGRAAGACAGAAPRARSPRRARRSATAPGARDAHMLCVRANGIERAELDPARVELRRAGAEEAADVGAAEGDTGERQVQQHRQRAAQVRPAAGVVAGPDRGVALDAGVAGARQHEGRARAGARALERSARRAAVLEPVEVAHATRAARSRVALDRDRACTQRATCPASRSGSIRRPRRRSARPAGRLVHVVPDAGDAGVEQRAVLLAPPGAHVRAVEVGQRRLARPHAQA